MSSGRSRQDLKFRLSRFARNRSANWHVLHSNSFNFFFFLTKPLPKNQNHYLDDLIMLDELDFLNICRRKKMHCGSSRYDNWHLLNSYSRTRTSIFSMPHYCLPFGCSLLFYCMFASSKKNRSFWCVTTSIENENIDTKSVQCVRCRESNPDWLAFPYKKSSQLSQKRM